MRTRARWAWAVAAATALGTIGMALAQDRAPEPEPKGQPSAKAKPTGKAKAKSKGGLRAPGGAPPRAKGRRPDAADPLAKQARAAQAEAEPPTWPFHYKIKVRAGDGTPLAAAYYPSKLRLTAPVLLLVHEPGPGRSGRDFAEPIEELQGQGLAEALQRKDYAVLVVDLRGHGDNPQAETSDRQWRAMTSDLQAAYLFLVDRHNRGELNVGKLGVIALGEGANLAAAWAATPGAATGEGRIGDLGALVLVNPVADARGLRLTRSVATLAPRVPILLVASQKNRESLEPAKEAQRAVERNRRGRVAILDTALRGAKLIQFFPKVTDTIAQFLDDPVKYRTVEWEGRYNLPPAVELVEVVTDANSASPADASKKAEESQSAEPSKRADEPTKAAEEPAAKGKSKAAPRKEGTRRRGGSGRPGS